MRTRWVALGLALLGGGAVAAQQETPEPPYRLQVGTQLVLVDASVVWKKTGQPLVGLGTADFAVAEDGAPQEITSLSQDAAPLSLVFLFDLTDTVHPVLQHLADGAAEVLRHLRPRDEVAVMSFSSHATVNQVFTRDRMTAVEGIDAASASYDRKEPTFVYEDLWEAAQTSGTSRLTDARRVQLWVTDGSANDQDTQRGIAHHAPATLHTEAQATEALLRSGVVVSALFERSRVHGSGRFGDVEHYAALTGGPVVTATADDAAPKLARLLDTLRSRYTIGYKPSAAKADGALCQLRVALSPAFWAGHPEVKPRDLEVRARASYLRSVPNAIRP